MRPSVRHPLPLGLSAIALALVAACGSTAPTRPPVVTPSGPVAPDGSVDAGPGSARADLAAFETEIREATARHGALVRSLAAASAGTADDLRAVVVQMRAWVQAERDWLDAHPADPCFDPAARRFAAGIDAMATSADWLSASVEASLAPSDDVSRGSARTEASNDLQVTVQALADAAEAAKTARSSC